MHYGANMALDPTTNILQFSERVRVMNQMKQQELRLTAQEASNLQADITRLLAETARLAILIQAPPDNSVELEVSGGSF